MATDTNHGWGLVLGTLLASAGGTQWAAGQTLAFPEAEGFGRFATGARTTLSSASVYHVTNLNDSGAGSFRDAVSQANRFVVFDVGGILKPTSALTFASNLTIAGQTAPGGFAVYNNRSAFHGANNLISRHWATRMGNSLGREDAAGIVRGTNMMFDHMSITWGGDGTFDINPDDGATINNLTIQSSIVGQGLDALGHSTGGLMTLGTGNNFSIVKSLFAANVTRNPKVRGNNEFINNVVYAYETAGYIMGDTAATSYANAEGNYFIEGPVDGSSPFASGTTSFHIFGRDNWVDTNKNGVLDGSLITSYPGADVLTVRNAFPTTATLTAQQAVANVIKNVGPSVIRDAVDQYIVNGLASYGTAGGVIQREQTTFPGYGTDAKYLNPRARLVDTDADGIPDNWETAHGLSPTLATDWKGLNAAGYTRLEEYLNELGADGTMIVSAGGTWGSTATWGGTPPTFADDAVVVGNLGLASGNAFARRLTLGGNLAVSGGTLDVFDTATVTAGAVSLTGGTTTAGRLLLGSTGQAASLSIATGATLQTGTVTTNGGTATLDWNGGTIRATGTPAVTLATTLGAAGGTFDTNGYDGVFSGKISGSGAFVKVGAGTLTLSAANAYTGGTNVTGNLKLASNTAAGTGTITINAAGGGVQFSNGVTVANNVVSNFNFEVLDVPDDNAVATLAGNLTRGNGQLRIRTTGSNATLNLTGASSAGSLFILSTGNVVLKGAGSITSNGGIFGRGAGDTTFTAQDTATVSVGGFSLGGGQPLTSSTFTVAGNATVNSGANNIDLLASSTATAVSTFNLNGGTTTAGAIIKTSVAGQTSTLNFNGGTLKYGGTVANASFLAALTGLTANVAAGGAKFDDNGQAITVSQPLLHSAALAAGVLDGGLSKTGNGTLTLAGLNTYTGPTAVRGGTLSVATLASGGTASGIGQSTSAAANLVLDNGTLQYTGPAATVDRGFTLGAGGGTIERNGSGNLVLSAAADVVQTGVGNRTLTLAGDSTAFNNFYAGLADPASGKTALTKSGAGTWRLFGNPKTYSGDTTISGGTLYLTAAGILPTGTGKGDVNVSAGTLDLFGSNHTFNGLNGAGTVTTTINTARTLTVGNANANGNFAGTLTQGAGQTLSVTKIGTGAQTLSGASSYTGVTTVKAGTLILGRLAHPQALAAAGGADVQGGKLVLNYAGGTTPVLSVKAILDSGYADGFAVGQIRATTLAAGQTLGYGDDGAANVTIRVTLPGDADLDGDVDFNDFLALQTKFGQADTRFDQGNFNYDGATDFNDFLVLQTNFGQSVSPAAAMNVTASQFSQVMAITAAGEVPEPAGVALLGVAASGLLRRRRTTR